MGKNIHSFIIVSDDNGGMRYDRWSGEEYIEILDVNGADTSNLRTFFQNHSTQVQDALGRIQNIRTEFGEIKADVFFGRDGGSIFQKYEEGILTDVSIGYTVDDYTVEEREGQPPLVTVTKFKILETSSVGLGFDRNAKHISKKSLERERQEKEQAEKDAVWEKAMEDATRKQKQDKTQKDLMRKICDLSKQMDERWEKKHGNN